MKQFEVRLRDGSVPTESIIERALAAHELQVTLKSSLRQFPGCVHWHAKRGKQQGTLEVTLWREQNRLWISVQDGRTSAWIASSVRALRGALGT